jgi:hypothetical protein
VTTVAITARGQVGRRDVAVAIAARRREEHAQLPIWLEQARDRFHDAGLGLENAAEERAPRKVHGHLVSDGRKIRREPLDPFHEERDVTEATPFRAPCAVREPIGACVDRDCEGRRLAPRAMEGVAAVARAHVNEDAGERGG